jgi:predicted nuclease with TOPRIM domain
MEGTMEAEWPLADASKMALQFAWAAAQERTGHEPAEAEVEASDLLVGMLLSDPEHSEAERAFRHFDLVAGQALPEGYPPLTADGLNRRLSAMSTGEPPPLAREAEALVQNAISFATSASRAGEADLCSLWAALLDGDSATSGRIRLLLTQRGIAAGGLAEATRAWIARGAELAYDEVLAAFPSAPIHVVNYKADQPRRGGTPPGEQNADYIGISPEVDAFAYLIASRSLEPPLAVGLFGEWGSGKSYFLDAIQRRVDELITSKEISEKPQREIPFWKRIVQVNFNAWHYVEGDLWSSLVDQIFTQLNLASESLTDDEVERRQRYYLHQLETTSDSLKRLEAEERAIERELQDRRDRLAELERHRDEALEALRKAQADKVVAREIDRSKESVVKALRSVGLERGETPATFGEALDSLAAARAELLRGGAMLRPILAKPRLTLALLAALLVAAVIPAVIEKLTASGIAASFAGLASFVTVATGVLRTGTGWVRAGLDEIDRARQQVSRELTDAEAAWHQQVETAEQQVKEANDRLNRVRDEAAHLRQAAAKIRQELEKRPPEILYEFLRERLDAGEYRKRLGVPAIIRRDFKGLADLIGHQNRFLLASDEEKGQIHAEAGQHLLDEQDSRIINRIVLYIDDLDRCPDAKVIEVLQAVHLLLAFPLFVVVVAVDSRWLAHALQSRYPALAARPSGSHRATAEPDDYLEKIFQVPFWVQELDSTGRSKIVRGLLGGHVVVEAPIGSNGHGGQLSVGPKEATVLAEMIAPRNAPPLLHAAALTVTRDELAFLDRLAPLMGHTPRSIKRFVNVYQLAKILRRSRPRTADSLPADEEIAGFLLAVAEGLPGLGWRLLDEAADEPAQALPVLLNRPSLAAYQTEHQRLQDWLADDRNAPWREVSGGRLAALAPDVRRFLFRGTPAAEPGMSLTRPRLVHVIHNR